MGLETVIVAKNMENKNITYRNIQSQSDAVLHFLQNLDIEMIDAVLEENRTYQDLEKHVFIQKLGYAFDEFIQSGETFLNRHPGFCNSEICNFKCTGFSFIGNNSRNYFDLIVDIKEGVVHDIYECTKFKCFEGIVPKNRCIYLDNSELSF